MSRSEDGDWQPAGVVLNWTFFFFLQLMVGVQSSIFSIRKRLERPGNEKVRGLPIEGAKRGRVHCCCETYQSPAWVSQYTSAPNTSKLIDGMFDQLSLRVLHLRRNWRSGVQIFRANAATRYLLNGHLSLVRASLLLEHLRTGKPRKYENLIVLGLKLGQFGKSTNKSLLDGISSLAIPQLCSSLFDIRYL